MNDVVHYEAKESHALVRIDNGKANAISFDVIQGIHMALDKAEADQQVVVLTGKTGILSGGFDLKVMTEGPEAALKLVTEGSRLCLRMLSFPQPIIAACPGHAIAKGCFLLLCCDYRIGVEGPYKIGLNEVMIGMTMHHAGIEMAKARLSAPYLDRTVVNAEIYGPNEALQAGILDKVVAEDALYATADYVAAMFGKINAKAHHQTKVKMRQPMLSAIEEAIALDLQEGVRFSG